MSTFKCKMCGGTLEIKSGSTVAECEYCGAKQTLPKLDDEKRANLYDRANHFRRNNEFDKAMGIYEQILNEDNTDAEAYWSLVLCRYGIEYVEDPLSHRRVPTVHRTQFTSIFDDDNYKMALKNADMHQRILYEEEAKAINEIQKGILAISAKEEPFDVFICYKETDDSGKRTHDSVLAQDLYYQLTQEGFKVFFAKITLEDKLGSAYEPYIFAALNSAKVMVVLGTKPEYFNAVWVKNEWSRYLSLLKNGEKKMLIPAYKDMDPYNLPDEFSHLQAQDMSKLGFMQDLIRGIKKILGRDKKPVSPVVERVVVQGDSHTQEIAPLLKRAFLFLEDGEFDNADEYAEKVLDIDPECAEAYVAKLLIELRLKKPSDLAQCKAPISDSHNYQKAIRFASPEYRETIEGYNNAIIKRIDTARKDEVYARGVELMRLHRYDEAVQYFQKISTYKDSAQKIDDCNELKETERLNGIYETATQLLNAGQFDEAVCHFLTIEDYKDSKEKIKLCGERKEMVRKDAIYSQAMNRVRSQDANDVAIKKSIEELQTISGHRDVDDQIRTLNARLEKWYDDKKKAEEAARIKAEEERRTREREAELRRIKAEKTKQTAKHVAKIGVPSIVALVTLLVLVFTLIVPLIRYNAADKFFNDGKYNEAIAIYNDLDGFSDSEQRVTVLIGIDNVDNAQFEDGIKQILSAGVPVKLSYGMGGGEFSDVTYAGVFQWGNNSDVARVFASTVPTGTASNTTTTANVPEIVEYTYDSATDFSGIQTPSKNGYRFVEWELETYSYQIGSTFEIKLNAVWSAKEYVVEYNLDGGNISGKNVAEYDPEDEAFTLINPTRTGYTFTGWLGTDLDEPTINVTVPSGSYGNRSYTATWKANEYTVTYDAAGGTVSSKTQKVYYDSDVEYIIPERAGYNFLGWYENTTKHVNEKWTRTSDLSLVAKWKIINYTINYELNGGTNHIDNPASFTVVTETIILQEPSRTGYIFTGWTFEGNTTPTKNVTISQGTTGEKSYIANWQAIPSTITLDASGGYCSVVTLPVTYDQGFTLPDCVLTGHTFAGWYMDNTKIVSGVCKFCEDVTLVAKWDIVQYSITYTMNGGTNAEANPTEYNCYDAFSLENPTKTGYTFLGWTFSSQSTPTKNVTVVVGTTGDKAYTANWQANTHTVTFDANGGTVSLTSKDATFDTDVTLPTPTRTGYTFGGWFADTKQYTTGTWKTDSDVTLIAKWTANSYLVTYDANSGECSIKSQTVVFDENFSAPTPMRTGYTFNGWYNGTEKVESDTWNIARDVLLTAKWTANSYTITYDANGGECDINSQEVVFDDIYSVPAPTRTGYTFDGWFDGETEYTDGMWQTANDVALVAKWTVNSYKITYEDTIPYVVVTFNYNVDGWENDRINSFRGNAISYPDMPEREGYIFTGWYLDENATVQASSLLEVKEDYVLYAGWMELNNGYQSTINPVLYSSIDSAIDLTTEKTQYCCIAALEDGVHSIFMRNIRHWSNSSYNYYYAADVYIDNLTTGVKISDRVYLSYSDTFKEISFTCNQGDVIQIRMSRYNMNYYTTVKFYFEGFNCYGGNSVVSTGTHSDYRKGEFIFEEVFYDQFVQLPSHARTGYTFDGWYNGDDLVESGVWNIVGDATLTSRWTANAYTITYDANGGECNVNSQEVVFDDIYSVPAPMRTGYTFDGWFDGETEYTDGTWQTTKDVTLVAKWVPRDDVSYVVNHYQQNANDNGYTLESTQNLTGTADSTITPSINAYEHFISPSAQTVTVKPDGSLVVDYYYDRVTYELTYVTNGGNAIDSQTYKYDQTLVVETPQRTNYTFGGWFTDSTLETEFSATATLNDDTTIYAWWTEENKAGDFAYNGTSAITVSAYNGTNTTMWIPSYIGGIPVTTISASAFTNKAEITKVVVSDSVTSIGEGAFKGCVAIKDITLPFVGASASATGYTSVFGYIFGYTTSSATGTTPQYNGSRYYHYYIPTTIKNVTITVQTDIPVAAFDNCNFIESITLPTTVTSIGSYAFQNCSGLKRLNSEADGEFNVPTGVEKIEQYAFKGCSELTTLTLGSDVTSIGSYAFAGCSLLSKFNSTNEKELIVPSKVETIGSYAFQNVLLVTKVVVSDSVTSIDVGAFNGCVAIEDITLPFVGASENCTSDRCMTFGYIFGYYSSNMSSDYLTSGSDKYTSQYISESSSSKYGYYIPKSLKTVIITKQTSIPYAAFMNCDLIKSITIPDDTISVSGYAFYNCTSLGKLNGMNVGIFSIPQSVTKIEKHSFQNCLEATNITLSDSIVAIDEYAFSGCAAIVQFNSKNLSELKVPAYCTSVGTNAFSGLAIIANVLIPDSVETVGFAAFKGCSSIKSMTLPFVGKSENCISDGCMTFGYIFGYYSSNMSSDYLTSGSDSYTSQYISESSSSKYGYYIPKSLKTVIITKQTSIPYAAFMNCDLIESITIPDNTISIGGYAFYNCKKLSSLNSNHIGEINIPSYVTTIERYTFYNCIECSVISLSNKVAAINSCAFCGCAAIVKFNSNVLGEMIIPASCEKIGESAFYGLSEITTLRASDMVSAIGTSAFGKMTALQEMTVPFIGNKNKTSTDTYQYPLGYFFGTTSYSGGVSTKQYYYGANTTSTTYDTYYIPTTLTKVVVTIGDLNYGAFYGCSNIMSITVNANAIVDAKALYSCSATLDYVSYTTPNYAWDGKTVTTGYHSGSGVLDDPYIIANGDELAFFTQQVNAGVTYEGVYFKLSYDIVLGDYEFETIGTDSSFFKGIFDGAGHTISGLTINSNQQYVGLFSQTSGTIKSLGIYGIITQSTETNLAAAGMLVGQLLNGGTISDCYTVGTLISNSAYTIHCGGLVGYSKGTITNSYSSVYVKATSSSLISYAGGLVGYLEGTAINSIAYGDVYAKGATDSYSRNGGFVGYSSTSATITNCYRSNVQVLTKNGVVDTAYNELGIIGAKNDILNFCRESWDSTKWNFATVYPLFK